MAQIWKIRDSEGNVYQPGDWSTSAPLWSTVEIPAGPFAGVNAFSYGIGASVPGSLGPRDSTSIDTSLEGQGNVLPENEDMIIYQLGVTPYKVGPAADLNVFPDSDNPSVPLPDMLRLQRDLIINLRIAAIKDYTDACLEYFPAGQGVHYVSSGGRTVVSGAAPSGTVVGNNGSPDVVGQRTFASPFYVAGGEAFHVRVRSGPGSVENLNIAEDSRIAMFVILDGYHRRPVA